MIRKKALHRLQAQSSHGILICFDKVVLESLERSYNAPGSLLRTGTSRWIGDQIFNVMQQALSHAGSDQRFGILNHHLKQYLFALLLLAFVGVGKMQIIALDSC